MKIKPMSVLLVVLLCVLPLTGAFSQEKPEGQLFAIHEDVVNPSRVADYEKAAKNLAALFEQHNINGMQYSAANSNDFVYIYISPVENYAGLDKMDAAFGELQQKMGEDAFNKAMNMFSDNYDRHRDYMVRLHPELSYKPEYGNNMADGMNFRHWNFYHVYPGKEAEIENIAMEWIDLLESKGIQQGYRLYTGGMGTDMPLVIVAHSALNATDFYTNEEKNMAALGEAGKKLMAKTMSITWKFESKDGMMRPDLSFIKPQVAQAEN